MSGSLVADLGLGPRVWLLLSCVGCLSLFFKFGRFWSVRNLDLILLFSMIPGIMSLVGNENFQSPPWVAYVMLFIGGLLWLARCFVDLGLSRRPILEPNLSSAGLTCLSLSILGLLITETMVLPAREGLARNPADANSSKDGDPAPAGAEDVSAPVNQMIRLVPLPRSLKANSSPVILSRVLAALALVGVFVGIVSVGWVHFGRLTTGIAAASCFLILPYARFALVDGGQLVPAALVVAAIVSYHRPIVTGILIGLAGGWMPACLGLIPLWTGFYRGKGALAFVVVSTLIVGACLLVGWFIPDMALWARALGARTLYEAGLIPGSDPPLLGSFWARIDSAYRLPVLITYLSVTIISMFWPADKNLGELISISAALLIGSQFWYQSAGGTHIVLYLPLVVLMVFRPNLSDKKGPRPRPRKDQGSGETSSVAQRSTIVRPSALS